MSRAVCTKHIKKSKQFVQNCQHCYKKTKNVDDFLGKEIYRRTTKKEDMEDIATLQLQQDKVSMAKKGIYISLKYSMNAFNWGESEILYHEAENLKRNCLNVVSSDKVSFWSWIRIKYVWSINTRAPGPTIWETSYKSPYLGMISERMIFDVYRCFPRMWIHRKCSKFMNMVFWN